MGFANPACRLAFFRIQRKDFRRWSFGYVQTASAGNEGTRNKEIYDSGDDIDVTHDSHYVVPQNHRATTLHARATSASLARDWSSAKMASMAFSTCTWARSRHLFRPGGQRIEGGGRAGSTAGNEKKGGSSRSAKFRVRSHTTHIIIVY